MKELEKSHNNLQKNFENMQDELGRTLIESSRYREERDYWEKNKSTEDIKKMLKTRYRCSLMWIEGQKKKGKECPCNVILWSDEFEVPIKDCDLPQMVENWDELNDDHKKLKEKQRKMAEEYEKLIESEAFWKNEAIRNRSDLTLIQTTLRERFHITLKWETDDNGTRVDFLSDGKPVSSIFSSKSEVKKMEEKLADLERVQKHHKVTLEKQDKIIRYFKHYFNNPSKMNCLKPYYDVMDKELKDKYHQEFTMKFCQLNQELPADLQVDIPEGDLGQIHDAYFFFSGLALYLRFQ